MNKQAYEESRMATHKRLYDAIWCNHFNSFEDYMLSVAEALRDGE